MTPDAISTTLTQLFGSSVATLAPGSWQVEAEGFRLLVLLSEDSSWLRALIPIVPAADAQPFFEQLMEANFDLTQETRYAISQGVLWGVYQHSREGLTAEDFTGAVQQLIVLHQRGLNDSFNSLVEDRVKQIIKAAKQNGQSLEMTLQTLDRFYEEGVMGELGGGSAARQETLEAWRYQLERLWSDVESGES